MAVRRVDSEGEVRSFLLEECNLGSIFYYSEIRQRRSDSCRTVSFDCVLERRRRELVDASLILETASVEVLVGVVTALANCSTWTHAKFQFRCGGYGTRCKSRRLVFERRMFEVYHLHRSSPSLLCLDVDCDVAYSHARRERLTVQDATANESEFYTHFRAFLEALAGGVSRNSALKSLTLHTSRRSCHLADVKPLGALFTSASMISVTELVLHFPDCVPWNSSATVVNLVRWNTTLEKLTLCSTKFGSWLKDVTYIWTSENHKRTLQVKYSGMHFFFSAGLIEPLAEKFSLDYSPDSIFPRDADPTTLHLILPLDQGIISTRNLCRPSEWEKTFRDNMLALVTSVATMSARSTTLKHVQLSFEWGREVKDMICSYRKQVELSTQEKLREIMVGNEWRGNTSLETLEVGFWKLIRRGQHVSGGTDEWHTSYGGPCLSTPSNEYVVKVQM